MSGFGGGGFGGGSGFGTPNNQSSGGSNNLFGGGGGFGSSSGNTNPSGGFGNSSGAPTTNPFGGGGGSSGFGSSGSSNNTNNGFGSSPPAAAPFGGSGNTNNGGGMSFGASPNVMVGSSGSSGFGGGSSSGFGGGSSSGFGGGTTSFSSQTRQQANNTSSFGNPFGDSQPQSSTSSFAGPKSQPQQQSSVTFGVSSNVVVNQKSGQTFGGGGNAGSAFGGSNSSGFGKSSGTNSSGFGKSSGFSGDKSGASGFGQPSSFNNKTKNSSNNRNPFGDSQSKSGSSNPFAGGADSTSVASPFAGGGAQPFSTSSTMSSIPEKNVIDNTKTNDAVRRNIDSAQAQMEEKKRILRAKIEEKKRKLLEKQQKKREEARSKSPTPMSAPTKSSTNQRDLQKKPQTANQSLAERNALRFAKHHNNQASMRSQSPVPAPSSTGNSKEREDLKHAVSLVGLCQTMCPFDELERRKNESDIQALEVPLPGTLHPPNWTLNDTAIKRFRRSAADYKLDVPEWVRPPEVLERTLGYLEEWIMERDRQGPDPRFPRKDIPPPPLDVYQFIWDRTRMIRKDFILQNYVGTGGRCDAKAVRCHERIARWHAMCEHQLSHIEDFVKMQSQQNMQELGQTMKTLNSFYDDALNRSTKEVPDEKTGRETFVPDTNHTANVASDKNGGARGGCLVDEVQGQNPMDYDGQLLNNAKNNPMIGQRLVGDNNNKTMARGTAEPEMRGIYMLLTMENEGGMEVLKYAAKLFKERPAVYHSPPVQLALTIFKAIKDMNYVKFFSILRSPSTPYLFSCIMFKQVEIMRRIAIQIMSISYGARNKNTGEAMYDIYPLERLMHVLCFEDMTEARKTCEFYNITVKDCTSQRTGEVREVIFWKGSKFKVPKDPDKGHTLHLKPKKMIRTIESKLNGATRLAICRGEVSGKGATLMSIKSSGLNAGAVPFTPGAGFSTAAKPSEADAEAKANELMMMKKLEQVKREQLAKQKKEMERQVLEERRKLELQKREEKRKRELEEKAKQAAELERRRLKKIEEEKIRQKKLKEERLKKIKEAEIARNLKEEQARKEAEEAARKQRELEEKRKREEQEKQRELERRIAEEKRLKQLEEERRRRKMEEERRREILRRELEAKRKREAEEKRKADEWQKKVDAAAKVLMLHRWKRVLSRPIEASVRSKNSLREIDLSFQTDPFNLAERIRLNNLSRLQAPSTQLVTSKTVIEKLLRDESVEEKPKLNVASMALQEINSLSNSFVGHAGSQKSINLLKIALICPETMDVADQSYASLLYHWIGSRINLGKIDIAKSESNLKFSSRHEVRTVVVRGSSYEVCSSCDIALFLIPPHWSDPEKKAKMLNRAASSLLDENIPRVALALNDNIDGERTQRINNVVAAELGGNMKAIPVIQPSKLSTDAFDGALKFALRRIANLFIGEACVSVIRIPAMQLATNVILTILWQCIPSVLGRDEDEDTIVECSRLSMRFLISEIVTHARLNDVEWSLWPAPEFSSHEDLVESYFAENQGLPLQWTRSLSEEFLQETYQPLLEVFRGHFRDAYQRIVVDAPITVQDDCASECAQGQYRRCLQKALMWMQEDFASNTCYIYLPEGMVDTVVKDVAAKVKANLPPSKSAKSIESKIPTFSAELKMIKDRFTNGSMSAVPATPAIGNGSILSTNKRSRSANQLEHSTKKKRREGEEAMDGSMSTAETNIKSIRYTSPKASRRKNTLSESKAYTMKLERLLRGDETIDMNVGHTLLSRYLRDVPEPQAQSKD